MKFNEQTEKILEELSRQERIEAVKKLPVLTAKTYTVHVLVIPPDDDAWVSEHEVQATDPNHAQREGVKEVFQEYDNYTDQQLEEMCDSWENEDDQYEFDEFKIHVQAVYLGKLVNLV